jgi:hypothetical protein
MTLEQIRQKQLADQERKVRSNHIERGGSGVRTNRTPSGNIISMTRRTFGFAHPFAVSLYGGMASITPGQVNSITPTIDNTPLTGDSNGVLPQLQLKKSLLTATSYIALEITRIKQMSAPTGAPLIVGPIIVVHIPYLGNQAAYSNWPGVLGYPNLPGNKTHYPLAFIDIASGLPTPFQIAFFNVQYFAVPTAGGAQHYFAPM